MGVKFPPDMLDYVKPTDEEVAAVLDYWAQVRLVIGIGGQSSLPANIDRDLLTRVAVHQAWQSAMICTHPTIVMDMDGIRCGECDRACHYLSDVQIQAIKQGVSVE